MPTTDITKKFRISSQLSSVAARAVGIDSIITDINFKSKASDINLRLRPITLDISEKTITVTMQAAYNDGIYNFGIVPSEWFEYIEATFALMLEKYLNKDLS